MDRQGGANLTYLAVPNGPPMWTCKVNQMDRCVALHYGEVCEHDYPTTEASRPAVSLTFKQP